MRPYKNRRLTDEPDVGDIRAEGRRSAVGRIRRGDTKSLSGFFNRQHDPKVVHNDRGYSSPKNKASVRRNMKRADKAKTKRLEENPPHLSEV